MNQLIADPQQQASIEVMKHTIVVAAAKHLGLPVNDRVLSDDGNTGSIVLASDISMSNTLLGPARMALPGSFSEEDDPIDPTTGKPKRLPNNKLWMIDPVDGSGDRKKAVGGLESASAKGYSVLATLIIENTRAVAGLVFRPAYREMLTFENGRICKYRVNTDGGLEAIPFERKVPDRKDQKSIFVNTRPAYPDTNLTPDFWELANQGDFKFEAVSTGGAGDSLSHLVEGELDIVNSGHKGDWKDWDTGPFVPMLASLRGQLTDYDGNNLGAYAPNTDLWHTRGTLASIGCPEAHKQFVEAVAMYEEARGVLVWDTRKKLKNA